MQPHQEGTNDVLQQRRDRLCQAIANHRRISLLPVGQRPRDFDLQLASEVNTARYKNDVHLPLVEKELPRLDPEGRKKVLGVINCLHEAIMTWSRSRPEDAEAARTALYQTFESQLGV